MLAPRILYRLSIPIERLNGEIERCTELVGIFPNDGTIVRLVGALLLNRTMCMNRPDLQGNSNGDDGSGACGRVSGLDMQPHGCWP